MEHLSIVLFPSIGPLVVIYAVNKKESVYVKKKERKKEKGKSRMRKRFRLSAPTILAAGTATGPAAPVRADLGTYHESTADTQTNHNASICTLHF